MDIITIINNIINSLLAAQIHLYIYRTECFPSRGSYILIYFITLFTKIYTHNITNYYNLK